MFFTTSHVLFSMTYFWEKTVPKTHEKVRNVCPMLVNVKKCMYFAHVCIKRNVLMDN